MKRILLVEPSYRNKYPPLGLMKISSYHKLRGDYVHFVKGKSIELRNQRWDRIYISTLFTFHWNVTLDTIKYYVKAVHDPQQVFVGGVTATLLSDEIRRETGANIIRGLVNIPGQLEKGCRKIVDHLIPDYDILSDVTYEYNIGDAYLGYATRGCPNRCGFCAVRIIEPNFVDYLPLRKQIKGIESIYGPKKDLLLLDNNVLASRNYEMIIRDIIDLGFEKGAKFGPKRRVLDFNQGLDARLLTRVKLRLLAKTAIRPIRIAFDHISMKELYIQRIKMANDCGIPSFSNYVLYNYTDTPKDFYQRLKINLRLNRDLDIKIYSFPMKYIPLDAKDRSYVGKNWNRKFLRGVQCILLATKGKVGTNYEFFKAAFGSSYDEFCRISMMPEQYIIYRHKHQNNGAFDWSKLHERLGPIQRKEFHEIVATNNVTKEHVTRASSVRLKRILRHYVEA